MPLPQLNFPAFDFRIDEKEGKLLIFDSARKKYVRLTPEEWVRQNMVQYLHQVKAYPLSLICIEHALQVNRLEKRADILVYNSKTKPALLVECKASSVKVSQEVFEQAARYNLALQVEYLVVTNGLIHYCAHINHESQKITFQENIPEYTEI